MNRTLSIALAIGIIAAILGLAGWVLVWRLLQREPPAGPIPAPAPAPLATAPAPPADPLAGQEIVQTGTVTPPVELTVSAINKQAVGLEIQYTITVHNTGQTPLSHVMVTNTVVGPARLLRINRGGRISARNAVWSLGTLGPGQSASVSNTVAGEGVGQVTSEVTLRAMEGRQQITTLATTRTDIVDASPNRPVAATVARDSGPGLLLHVASMPDVVAIGQESTYTVTIRHRGRPPATDVTVRCVVPGQQQYVASTGPTLSRSVDGTITFSPLARVAENEQTVYRITVRSVQAGLAEFRAEVICKGPDSSRASGTTKIRICR